MTDQLRRREQILQRLEWLVRAVDGLDAIGRPEQADAYDAECGRLVREFEQLDSEIGVIFTPKLGRFSV